MKIFAKLVALVSLVVITSIFVGCSSEPGKGEETDFQQYERRIHAWMINGANVPLLLKTLRESDVGPDQPDEWAEAHIHAADILNHYAAFAKHNGADWLARDLYQSAAAHYSIARFPYAFTELQWQAYAQHKKDYVAAAELSDRPISVVKITFKNQEVPAYLRLKAGDKGLVVIAGGIDSWKSDLSVVEKSFHNAGLATLAVDIPGTGDNKLPMDVDSMAFFDAVLAKGLSLSEPLSSSCIAFYGQSVGGSFALEAAFNRPQVCASVAVSAPVSVVFENIKHAPDFVRMILERMVQKQGEDMYTVIESLSLTKKGVLNPDNQTAKILHINGDSSDEVPLVEMDILDKVGVKQERWVFEGDGQTAWRNREAYLPRVATWVAQIFGEHKK